MSSGTMTNATAREWASKKFGLDYEVARTERLQQALTNPNVYYRERTEALREVRDKVNQAFVERFNEIKSRGIPPDEAERRAEVWAASMYEKLCEDVNTDYPSDLNTLAANVAYKGGAATKANFDVNAAAPKKKAPKKKAPKAK